ncbi:MAG: DNA translocase FtsK [Spirochaetales bacterium]|nr:DNA translocase FtsK [Spirochaetales bacterium]
MAMDNPHGEYTDEVVELLTLPGRFLFASFLWAGFFVPFYVLANAYLLIRFNKRFLITLILLLFPFITVSLLLKVLFAADYAGSFLSEQIRTVLGEAGGGLLLFFCVLIQVIVIALITQNIEGKSSYMKDHNRFTNRGDASRAGRSTARRSLPVFEQEGRMPLLELPDSSAENDDEKEYEVDNDAEASGENGYEITGEQDEEGEELPAGNGFEQERGNDASYLVQRNITPQRSDKKTAFSGRRIRNRGVYSIPLDKVLKEYDSNKYWEVDESTKKLALVLKETLEEFKIQAEVTGIQKGPVITMFEILPAPGVKLSKIVNLADNIALRMAASRVRIVAPIPGKQAVGIEIPNKHRSIVSLKEIVSSAEFQDNQYEIPLALGMDITGNIQTVDLVQMPHLLIAGATGSGKSVCVNSIICSILCKRSPEEVRLMLIDPKIVELKYYNDIPHLLTPVITEAKKAFQALQYCISEMERRYALLDSLCVRDIRAYNKKIKKKRLATTRLPYIVIIIDEFADLIATSGKEMESLLARLAAMSRAVGIHLALATQRPSIDVITGLIKANIPSRIAFMVASKFDSRIIIDSVGAEKLLGQGDMLFVSSWHPFPTRIQGAYISEEEVEELIDYVKGFGEPEYIDDEIFIDEDDGAIFEGEADPLMDKALDIILASGKASTSYLQRKLKIGYNRAARLIEELELRGIVGPPNGSKPREILHVPNDSR